MKENLSKDSYIYFDGEEIPEKERKVHIQCINCHKKNKKGKLWQAKNGYGPWNIICPCGEIIYKVNN